MTTWYVSVSGSDHASGSETAPFATIPRASTAARSGDTVEVGAGSYFGGFKTDSSGNSGNMIRYIGKGARIVGGSQTNGNDAAWWQAGDWVEVNGFEFDMSGADAQKYRIGIYGSGGNCLYNYLTVHGVLSDRDAFAAAEANQSGGAGIYLDAWYGGQNSVAFGNVVYNVGPPGAISSLVHAMYMTQSGAMVGNSVRDCCDGIHAWHAVKDVNFSNNTIVDGGKIGIIVGSSASGYGGGFVVNNNLIVGTQYGIYEEGTVQNTNTYQNNLIWDVDTPFVMLKGKPQGTVQADPQFVGTGTHPHQLQASSPAINAAVAKGAPDSDLLGTSRPQGSNFDIGAYEYTSGGGNGEQEEDVVVRVTVPEGVEVIVEEV